MHCYVYILRTQLQYFLGLIADIEWGLEVFDLGHRGHVTQCSTPKCSVGKPLSFPDTKPLWAPFTSAKWGWTVAVSCQKPIKSHVWTFLLPHSGLDMQFCSLKYLDGFIFNVANYWHRADFSNHYNRHMRQFSEMHQVSNHMLSTTMPIFCRMS